MMGSRQTALDVASFRRKLNQLLDQRIGIRISGLARKQIEETELELLDIRSVLLGLIDVRFDGRDNQTGEWSYAVMGSTADGLRVGACIELPEEDGKPRWIKIVSIKRL